MKIRKSALSFVSLLAILLCSPISVFADTVDAKKVLNQYQFESHSVGGDVGRQIGWGIVTFLHWLVNSLEDVISNVNSTLGGFFQSADITSLQNEKIRPLIIALLAIVIMAIGIMYIIKPRDLSTIVGNLIIGMVIMVSVPTLLSTAYSLTNDAINFLGSTNGIKTSISDRILVDNITDNTLYDNSGFKALKYKNVYAQPKHDISQITKINPTETINDPDKMQHPDVWKNKLTTDQNGNQTLTALWDGKVGFVGIPALSEYYYRWSIDWFAIISTLFITAFALIFSSVKIARILYELVIQQTMTQALALLDIYSAQRVKKCLQMLMASFITLFAVFFMLQVYIIGTAYINANTNNFVLRLILMIALSWSVIDGPNLFEQIFGIDAGVQNATRTLIGMKAAGSMLAGGIALAGGKSMMDSLKTKGIIGTAKTAVGKIGGAVGGASGIVAGLGQGAFDNRSRLTAAMTAATGGSGAATNISQGTKLTDSSGTGGGVPVMHDMDNAEQTQPGSTAIPDNSPVIPAATEEKQEGNTSQQDTWNRETLGSALKSRYTRGVQNTSAVRAARRMYNLTYGSSLAHGDKKILREQLAHHKMQENPQLSHRQAIRDAKAEIKDINRMNRKGVQK
ncbi:pLS20_p028 family conjugation system transmembrane protein [Thermocaproicibacter melissae]|uniref:pLS20_p028 family conjugation system transmembrane protein n=1 Tax=Thermocaproicibacter melissae TaxID=2966552 RepID=UPI0024B10F74|nr:hypothetical protein [Thermocaproicibacter melissae]WBY64696.1 hypothetical protein NOG13_03090 [Thermocaproicibacter melissae]